MSVVRSSIESMFDLGGEAELIDEITRLERVKSAAAAGQARLTAVLADKRRVADAAAGVPRAKQCRGLASEIALARRDSPARGGRHLGFARHSDSAPPTQRSPAAGMMAANDPRTYWTTCTPDLRGKIVDEIMTVTVLPAPRGPWFKDRDKPTPAEWERFGKHVDVAPKA
jgi:hypothetical protein